MNMTIKELFEKLKSKKALIQYGTDPDSYIKSDFHLIVGGICIDQLRSNESGYSLLLDQEIINSYGADDLVSVFFYRREML